MTDLTTRQMLDLIVQTLDENKKRFAGQRTARKKKRQASASASVRKSGRRKPK
jgi:hypothetical protein